MRTNANVELDAGTKTFASGLLPDLIAALRRSRKGDLVAVMGTRDQTAAFGALRLRKPGGAETAAGAD